MIDRFKRIYRIAFIIVFFVFVVLILFRDELTNEIGISTRTSFYYLLAAVILLFLGQILVELYSLRQRDLHRDLEDARKLVEDMKQKIQQATQEIREREKAARDNTNNAK